MCPESQNLILIAPAGIHINYFKLNEIILFIPCLIEVSFFPKKQSIDKEKLL